MNHSKTAGDAGLHPSEAADSGQGRSAASDEALESGQWRTMCEHSPDYMVVVDRQRRYTWVNRVHPGLTLEQVKASRVDDFLDPSCRERARRAIDAAFAGQAGSYEAHVVMEDGEENWFDTRVVPMAGRTDRVMLVTSNITERKRAELERDRMRDEAAHRHRLEAVGMLASGVAHEINNPMQAIMSSAEILQALVSDDAADSQELIADILAESERVARIVSELLAFSRKGTDEWARSDLDRIVQGACALFRVVLARDGIEIDISTAANTPQVECREQQIRQIVINLVANARDAILAVNNRDSPRTILVSIAPDGDSKVSIAVRDSGIGMPRGTSKRVFDPFYSTKSKAKGTGLGLYLSRRMVLDHHGELEFDSEQGKGTTVTLRLPVRQPIAAVPAPGTDVR